MTEPGLVVVDKPAGMTSHDVVGRCRRIFGTRKVGHAGTLDPMATGVLVVGIDRATKILGLLTVTDKSYAATIRLGQTTSTEDAEGDVLQTVSAAGVAEAQIETAVAALRGEIEQVPSAVSAIKVDGQRAYKLVREGHTVELAPRKVRIDRFAVLAVRRDGDLLDVDVEVHCTSGTYIRALAETSARRWPSVDTSPRCGVPASVRSGWSRPRPSTISPSNRACRIRWTMRA